MRIVTTTTEIECSAEELRQSNSLSDAFLQIMRKCFNGPAPTTYNVSDDDESDDDESEDDDEDNCD